MITILSLTYTPRACLVFKFQMLRTTGNVTVFVVVIISSSSNKNNNIRNDSQNESLFGVDFGWGIIGQFFFENEHGVAVI